MRGYALNTGRAAQGMPTRVSPAKIACLDFNLQKTKMQLGVQVLVNDPRELEKIRQRYFVRIDAWQVLDVNIVFIVFIQLNHTSKRTCIADIKLSNCKRGWYVVYNLI